MMFLCTLVVLKRKYFTYIKCMKTVKTGKGPKTPKRALFIKDCLKCTWGSIRMGLVALVGRLCLSGVYFRLKQGPKSDRFRVEKTPEKTRVFNVLQHQ